MLRVRLLEEPEDPFRIDLVLLDTVDGERVVIGRAAEEVPGREIRGVDVATGIDYRRTARMMVLEAQQLVVLVVAEALRADDPLVTAR